MARTDPQVNFRMPAYLKQRLESAATKHGRSVTQEIIQRLEHSFTPWQERPWEERMVIDVDRAMLRLLTKDEYKLLLDRVKNAGGADAVNGYAPTFIQSDEDLQYPIPDGPRLTEIKDIPQLPTSDKDAIATQLALKVLEVLGTDSDRIQAKQWKAQIDAKRAIEGKAPLSDVLAHETPDAITSESATPRRRFTRRKKVTEGHKEKDQ
ncbi:Arc family DNA-binding protein [Achromobacter sp. 2789STDY5608628]|uniref:Arc family DNA-binding protein n=1 Tax=Achromobacter sp. 2789STDY5608628 TaxID=1806493 RepID=UPI0009E91AA1|nr:Arc family DNA-binding protein [Achromobacter sp. 2789STDY5608628]